MTSPDVAFTLKSELSEIREYSTCAFPPSSGSNADTRKMLSEMVMSSGMKISVSSKVGLLSFTSITLTMSLTKLRRGESPKS